MSVGRLADLCFGVVGFLTIGIYGGLVVEGAVPEAALFIATGGGVLLGLLLSAALRVITTTNDPAAVDAPQTVIAPDPEPVSQTARPSTPLARQMKQATEST